MGLDLRHRRVQRAVSSSAHEFRRARPPLRCSPATPIAGDAISAPTLLDLTDAMDDRALIVPIVAVGLAAVDVLVPDGPRVHGAVVFVLADLANYGIHRALHRVPLLWRFHAVRHLSERLDWLATSRVHPIDLAVNITVVALPAQLLGQSSWRRGW